MVAWTPGPHLPLENCLNPISPGKGPDREEVGMPLGGSWGLPGVGQGFSLGTSLALSSPEDPWPPHLQEEGLRLPTEPAGVPVPGRGEQDGVGGHLRIGHSLLPGHQPDHHVREVCLGLLGGRASGPRGRLHGPLPAGVSSTHLGEHGIEAVQPALHGGHHVPGLGFLGLPGQLLQEEAAELPPLPVQVGCFGLISHAGQWVPVARTGRAGAESPCPLLTIPPGLSALPRPKILPRACWPDPGSPAHPP